MGSRQVCSEPLLAKRFAVVNSGSSDAAGCVLKILAKEDVHETIPFSSPMVIMTYKPIVALLAKIGVVTRFAGLTIFHVGAYLSLVRHGERWTDIPGSHATYPYPRQILVTTTDPRLSNSGGMFAAIAYAALNKGDPVSDLRPGDPRLAVIRKCFTEQKSNLSTSTRELVEQFLTDGMDTLPMAMVYENDYISARLSGLAGPKSQITVMYPDQDVISDNTLISWKPAGNRLTALLKTPKMEVFEEQHGYRTKTDTGSFVGYMRDKGIRVPNFNGTNGINFRSPPASGSLDQLISAVAPH